MIERYEVAEIKKIWNEEEKFNTYLEVEVAHLQTLEEDGIIQVGTADKISKAKINPARIAEIEMVTNHDVIAFCSSITEQFSHNEGTFFHFGITSSDIIDTAHALLIRKSIQVIEDDLRALRKVLWEKAIETKDLLAIGRSHGISAEAMIFGQKFLSFVSELDRSIEDLKKIQTNLTGQMSGAVGNYTVVTPEQEKRTLTRLNLHVEKVSTQVIPRDHYARIISIGGLIGTLLERMAVEFRLLQHSDIDEVKEGFSKGQKGSSTMPHKKNPISSENITGIARILRSHLNPILESCVLWHERDISHSSVERIIFPDHFTLLAFGLRRMRKVVHDLVIDRNKIESKALSDEKIFSSYVLHQLLLLNEGTKREILYEAVQKTFFESNSKEELQKNLKDTLEMNKFKHDVPSWLKIENLRMHYVHQFEKVLKRCE
jgi:adenylosuccinate lyase